MENIDFCLKIKQQKFPPILEKTIKQKNEPKADKHKFNAIIDFKNKKKAFYSVTQIKHLYQKGECKYSLILKEKKIVVDDKYKIGQ
jgi:hypothetical protein